MRTGRSEGPSCRSLSLLWKERKENLVRKLQLCLCRWIYLLWAHEPDEPLKLRMLCSTLWRKLCSILNLRMFTEWDQGLNQTYRLLRVLRSFMYKCNVFCRTFVPPWKEWDYQIHNGTQYLINNGKDKSRFSSLKSVQFGWFINCFLRESLLL